MRSSCFFLVVGICIGFSQIFGQKFQYVTYQGEDVPFQKVNQVIQDTKAYMWLATDQGLYRFNGSEFQDFNTSLSSKYIKSIIPWEKDTLLFSNDVGIFKLFYKEDQVQIVKKMEVGESGQSLSYPEKLFKDSASRLWVGQLDGTIFMVDKNTSVKLKIPLIPKIKTPKIFFAEDQFNTIWALIPNMGLYYFDVASRTLKQWGSFTDMQHFYIKKNKLLLVGERLLELTINANQKITSQRDFETHGTQFNFITKDRFETYFLSSDQGIFMLREDDGLLQRVFGSNDPHRVEELPYRNVNDLYFSSDQLRPGGIIWVSTSSGLGLMSSPYFQSISGLSHDNVFCLGATPNNEVLISQSEVYRITNNTNKLTYKKVEGVNRVTGIGSHKNDIWLGTAYAHILHYNANKLQREHDLSKRGGGIFFMHTDHVGDNWFCQAPTDKPIVGIAKINKKDELIIYDETKGLNSRVLVVDEGGRSELYAAGIGKENYLYKYDRAKDMFENKSVPFPFKVGSNFEVHDIAVDQKGMVWMGTTDGLLKYDTEQIRRMDIGASTRNEIRSVCTMNDGSLWLATDTNGLLHLSPDGSYVLFDEKSGTPSKVAAYRSIILDHKQKLWVGTAEGAVYSLRPNPIPLKTREPVLQKVQVDDSEQPITETISFSEGLITKLNFASINFPGDEIKYQYKIFEKDIPEDEVLNIMWSTPIEEPEVKIQGLKTGRYGLLVRAQKPGGYAWSLPANIDIVVKKKWYGTWWGITLFLSVGLLFFWYYARLWILKKVKSLEFTLSQKQNELNAKEAELLVQTSSLEHQKEALENAGTGIHIIHDIIKQIPQGVGWEKVLPVLRRLTELPTNIDALEMAFKKDEEVYYYGFKRGNSKLEKRQEEFNEKSNLASYVMSSNKAMLISDFDAEAEQYIDKKGNGGYVSKILVPFQGSGKGEMVFCIYSLGKHKFTERDRTLIQILSSFLASNTIDELK